MPGLFTKKSQPAAKPAISFPTRLSTQRKRDHHHVMPDENAHSQRGDRTHVRQRHDSITSVASVETIRPKTPTGPPPLSSKNNDGNSASLCAKEDVSRKKTKLVLKGSTSRNGDGKAHREVNTLAFPPEADTLPTMPQSPKRKAHADSISATQGPSTTKKKRMTRTVSCRSLSGLLDDNCLAPAVFEDDPEFVSPEDEEIIRCVVGSLTEDPYASDDEDDREFNMLLEESCLRQEHEGIQVISFPNREQDGVAAFIMKNPQTPRLRPSLAPEPTKNRPQLKRFDVDILPYNRRTAMWDASEKDFYAWPALLYITDHSPRSQGFNPHPPIESLHIEWRTVQLGESKCFEEFPDFNPPAEYMTKYMGQRLRESNILTHMHPLRGICIEPHWSYDYPVSEGGPAGWMAQFWVPVPMRLFSRYEYRTFRLRARINFGDWQTPRMTAYAGVVDVSIENLRREKEMHRKQ